MSEPQTRSEGDGLATLWLVALLIAVLAAGAGGYIVWHKTRAARAQAERAALLAEIERARAERGARLAAKDARDDAAARVAAQAQAQQLQGHWKAEWQVEPGTKGLDLPAHPAFHDRQFQIEGDQWLFTERSRGLDKVLARDKWTASLYPAGKPSTIDLLAHNGKIQQLGIYELTGDTLKLCLAPHGKDRPTAFKTDAQKGWVHYLLRRQQP